MTFKQYLKDKQFFLLLYVSILFFITLILKLSRVPIDQIIYIHLITLLLVGGYILIGFYYHRSFFQVLTQHLHHKSPDSLSVLPQPKNNQQNIYIQLMKKANHHQMQQLQTVYDEKKDHQEFILSWIHEVKTPIAASKLLLENHSKQNMNLILDKLEDEIDRIEQYLEQALYYTRIDSFSKDYFITEITLEEIIKKSVKRYAKSFIHKQIRFRTGHVQENVYTDPKWLNFIVDQITANALKYTEENGEIYYHVETDTKEKRLIIQDDGIGIKSEDIHRVFEKGFTGSIGRRHAQSTGIGLYLARKLALKLGHDLSIQSEEGKFTRVQIHFKKLGDYHLL